MTTKSLLRWLERGLLATGAALGVWCAVVLLEARYTQSMPIPRLVVTQTVLSGEANNPDRHALPAPAPGAWVARLEMPSVTLSTTVLEGTDDRTLSRGSGHIEDTPFPGQAGNIGIAGHRDTVFRPLRNIHLGDALNLTTADRVYHYKISKTLIVGPDDVYVLDPTAYPTLTLVTCYPFEFVGHAPRRFIVQADLVSDETRAAEAAESGRPGK
jgi:LPXTG-site transpeptidase (sortase) family protein